MDEWMLGVDETHPRKTLFSVSQLWEWNICTLLLSALASSKQLPSNLPSLLLASAEFHVIYVPCLLLHHCAKLRICFSLITLSQFHQIDHKSRCSLSQGFWFALYLGSLLCWWCFKWESFESLLVDIFPWGHTNLTQSASDSQFLHGNFPLIFSEWGVLGFSFALVLLLTIFFFLKSGELIVGSRHMKKQFPHFLTQLNQTVLILSSLSVPVFLKLILSSPYLAMSESWWGAELSFFCGVHIHLESDSFGVFS